MSTHSQTLGGFQGLVKDPFRWFASHLAVYGGVALATAILFVVGAAVYGPDRSDENVGAPPSEPPAPFIAPDSKPPKAIPEHELSTKSELIAEGPSFEGEVHHTVFSQAVSGLGADELINASVFGGGNEEIGKVTNLIFSEDGKIRSVVVDVGDFLGIGDKEVAIDFRSIKIRKAHNGEVEVFISATSDQLEKAPEYLRK
jgi:hypothetical protein